MKRTLTRSAFAASALTAAALLAAPTSATAQADFTLQVPVEITDLHEDVTEVAVRCVISDGQTRLGQNELQNGGFFFSERVPPTQADGSFSHTFVLEMDYPGVSSGAKRAATEWHCALFVGNGGALTTLYPGSDEDWNLLVDGEFQVSGALPG